MSLRESIIEVVREVVPAGVAGSERTVISIAFQAPPHSRGAVHVVAAVNMTQSSELTQRLCDALEVQGANIVWSGVWPETTLPGPYITTPEGVDVCIDLKSLDLPVDVQRLHVTQSIEEARKMSESAVLAVSEEVSAVLELADAHSTGLQKIASQFTGSSGEATVASTIAELSEQVRNFGVEIVERTTKQAADLLQARQWTDEIQRLASLIGDIASSARMVTVNARIEAARLGDAGRGFAIIAQSVQEITLQIRTANESVERLTSLLLDALPKLGASASNTSRDARNSMTIIETQLNSVREELEAAREESSKTLEASARDADVMRSKSHVILEKLQFQDRTSQMLVEAVDQTRKLLSVFGVVESPMSSEILIEPGKVGREMGQASARLAQGAVELF